MIVDHDVQFQQTEATYAESKQDLEIQESESLSEVKLVRQEYDSKIERLNSRIKELSGAAAPTAHAEPDRKGGFFRR